jgi:hypothetical protein
MRDDFTIPNLGDAPDNYDKSFLNRMYRNLEQTFTTLRARGRVQATAVNFYPYTVDGLATIKPLDIGITAYASNGRKNGEGAGAGTGVLVFYDGNNWIAVDSGQPVSA